MDKKIKNAKETVTKASEFFGHNKNKIHVSSSTTASLARDYESGDFLEAYETQENRFIPHVDFSTASNFARFGLAEKYYEDAFTRIYNQYPYDGSQKEKVLWEVSSSYIDKYVFENIYPRTTGYATIGVSQTALTGSPAHSTFRSYDSSTKEYIFIKGGPHADPNGDWKSEIEPGQSIKGLSKANIYDTSSFRESNLKMDFTYGNTVEFWLKKAQWANDDSELTGSALGTSEMIFDLWNSASLSHIGVNGDYGRFSVFLRSDNPGKIFATFRSGSNAAGYCPTTDSVLCADGFDTGLTNIADNTWHHYAIVTNNSGNINKTKLYVDGTLAATKTSGSTDHPASISAVTGAYVATIGSQVTQILGDNTGGLGWGKLSGSIDEFRFWKTARNAKEIGQFYIDQVNGGTNTDLSNTHLGVYYKFNEGITQTSSADRVVLDYSGRISNGIWTGYDSTNSRSTGSALVESGKVSREFQDPIIYSSHPDVNSTLETYRALGREHDYSNGTSLINSLPSWIAEADYAEGTAELSKLTQVLASYLDTLYLQMEALPKLKNKEYTPHEMRPYFLNDRILKDYGFDFDEILTDISLFSYTNTRDDYRLFEKKLYDIKNQIYKNIYNNLVYIYKTKGTKKSFRNLMRCIGIDEELVRLNMYGHNTSWNLQNNIRDVSSKSKYVDFYNNNGAVVYGYAEPGNPNSKSYISGSNDEASGIDVQSAITIEARVQFPKYPDNIHPTQKSFSSMTSSLFGLHTAKTDDSTDTAWATNDSGSLQVYAVRKQQQTIDDNPEVYFVLTGSAIGEITSSIFTDVYNNSDWNFGVRLKHSKHPQFDFISGSSASNSVVAEFIGYQTIADTVINNFSVTGTLNSSYGSTFFVVPKRAYVGAHRTNFSGTLLTESDVFVSNMRYWNTYLDDATLEFHAKNDASYGIDHPGRNTYLFEGKETGGLATSEMPKISALSLNWDFSQVTGSDTSGQFAVADFSSGSNELQSYSLSNIVERQHTGIGYGFPASSATVVERKYIPSTRLAPFDQINSDDMVEIVDFEGEIFKRNSRPQQFFFAFEKSMYANISDEMLNWFSTIKDFHNLIGAPVNKYREVNKDLNQLRELFFRRVKNIPDVDKFVEYFKWIDESISTMLLNLVPATANFADNIRTMIESHVLERNKIDTKYSNLNSNLPRVPSADGRIRSANELLQNWKNLHAPLPNSPLPENKNCSWWKDRAERSRSEITSGDATIDSQRETFKRVINSVVSGSTYALRQTTRPYHFAVLRDRSVEIDNTTLNFVKTELDQSSTTNNIVLQSIESQKDCLDNLALNTKQKLDFKAFITDSPIKGRNIAPFTAYSSSVNSGYKAILTSFNDSLEINDNHRDVYGTETQESLQGPFSKIHVGGKKSRKVVPFTTSERVEEYNLTVNSSNLTLSKRADNDPKSKYFLDEVAKRPVVIRNIKNNTSSIYLGNYTKEYQIVQTVGADTQRGWLKDNFNSMTQATPEILNLSGNIDFNTFERTGSSLQSVTIADRFSGPGSPEAMSPGYLDPASHTYSVYNSLNYRNMTVRMPRTNIPHSGSGASDKYRFKPFGGNANPALRTLQTNAPLNTRLRNFMAAYPAPGYDGRLSAPDGSALTASVHKVNRNRITITKPAYVGNVQTAGNFNRYDNGFIQRPIPQSDRQYSWITSSLLGASSGPYIDTSMFYLGSGDNLTAPLGYSTSSTDTIFISSSDFGSYFSVSSNKRIFGSSKNRQDTRWPIGTDFVGMNTNVYDPITASTNLLGHEISSVGYENSATSWLYQGGLVEEADTSAGATLLNNIINHRQGPTGWPTWRQIRTGNHPINRQHRKTNIFSTIDKRIKVVDAKKGEKKKLNTIDYVNSGGHSSVKNFTSSVVTSKYQPFTVQVEVRPPVIPPNTSLPAAPEGGWPVNKLNFTFNNNHCYFDSLAPAIGYSWGENSIIDIATLNNDYDLEVSSKQPSEAYKTITNLYSNNDIGLLSPVAAVREITLRETIWPRNAFTFLNRTRTRNNYAEVAGLGANGYDRISHRTFWRDTANDRLRTINVALNSQGFVQNPTDFGAASTASAPALSVWPLAGGWTGSIEDTTLAGTGALGQVISYMHAGELYNGPGIMLHFTISQQPAEPTWVIEQQWQTASCKYHGVDYGSSNYHFSALDSGSVYATSSFNVSWTTNIDRGRNPWFDSYEDYTKDLSRVGKDYSIIPEFNISDHLPYYVKQMGGDFLSTPPLRNNAPKDAITSDIHIPGIHNSSSNENIDFYEEYSHSDFLKNFDVVFEDHTDVVNRAVMKISCFGLKKLLPYNGFYPANRTLQLATLLSQSYEGHISGTQTTNPMTGFEDAVMINDIRPEAARQQAFLQPFFAPGILYNTIKSGIAVDWPLYTGSAPYGPTEGLLEGFFNSWLVSGSNYRLPFEALYDFSKLPVSSVTDLTNKNRIYTVGSWTNDTFFTWDGKRNDDLYERAMNNFLAETVNLFIKDSKLTSFVSKPMSEVYFEEGKTYKLSIDLEMANAVMTEGQINNSNLQKISDIYVSLGSTTQRDQARRYRNKRGVIYGPAVKYFTASSNLWDDGFKYGGMSDPAHAPYTPPYFYGKATVDLEYTNTVDDTPQPSLAQIFNSITASYSNNLSNIPSTIYDTGSDGSPLSTWVDTGSAAISTMMHVSSSLNLFGLKTGVLASLGLGAATTSPISISEAEDPSNLDRWVISTKFETPVLNFRHYTDDSKARGMWNGYGNIPDYSSQGLKITIRDTDPAIQNAYESSNEESLLDVMFSNISTRQKSVGQLPDDYEKSISECIIAIPFLRNAPAAGDIPPGLEMVKPSDLAPRMLDDRVYFKIQNGHTSTASSIADLRKKMKKFVFPPRFDFANNPNLPPVVMFAFEFTHKFTRQELQDIWQGVMPDISLNVEPEVSTLEIPSDPGHLMSDYWNLMTNFTNLPHKQSRTINDLQWMIFKVKQRAKNKYSNITEDTTDNPITMAKQNIDNSDHVYSYNWPYDYCSLVELGKVSVAPTLKGKPSVTAVNTGIIGFAPLAQNQPAPEAPAAPTPFSIPAPPEPEGSF